MELDQQTHERLKEINVKLTIIEKQIHTTAVRLLTPIQYEKEHAIEGLLDYDLSAKIMCYTGEEDAEPLCKLYESLYSISNPEKLIYFVNDGINHNEFHHWENHPMRGEHHCWLFHCLYDHIHPKLTWEQIASIEHICVDIKPLYQYQYELTQISSRAS